MRERPRRGPKQGLKVVAVVVRNVVVSLQFNSQGAPASDEICMLDVGDTCVNSVACDVPVMNDRLTICRAVTHFCWE